MILDDKSAEKINLESSKFKNFKKIAVLRVKENIGSQKVIAIGLDYLKNIKENFFITVMDSDGEDNPAEISRMLEFASKNSDSVITSNRKSRSEPLIIKVLYKIHLFLTFLFSFKWISFGNFTTFNSINLKNILNDNSSWLAYSSSIIKNCKIKRLYAKREKRYFDKSKLNLLTLMEHSLRVNAVFFPKIFFNSILYLLLIYFSLSILNLNYIFIYLIILFNFLLFYIRKKYYITNLNKINNLIDSIKLL